MSVMAKSLRDNLKPYKKGLSGVFFNDTRKWADPARPGKEKYIVLRYTLAGKTKMEILGWESDAGSGLQAAEKIKQFRANHKAGIGPTSLAEERELIEKATAKDAAVNVTCDQYWQDVYFPACQINKSKGTYEAEDALYRTWISPVIGGFRIADLKPLNVRRIRDNMMVKGRSASSIRSALSVISKLWSMAKADGIVDGESPTKDPSAKGPAVNNGKERYLTRDEADQLLRALRLRSEQVADMATLSLYCGLRAGEIFNLEWSDINFDTEQVRLKDTKTKRNRYVQMQPTILALFKRLRDSRNGDCPYVFQNRSGGKVISISDTFERVVESIGLNEGITDKRLKLTFHGLRHSCASFLVQSGVPLYTVSAILGHTTLRMTERYAHLAPDNLSAALSQVEAAMKPTSKLRKEIKK
jgi:integrase